MIDISNDILRTAVTDKDRIMLLPMRTCDVPDILKLEKRCYSLPWSASAYVTEVGNPSAQYLIAKTSDGALVGYGGVWVVMDEMHITTLAVDPLLRGKRVGERMLIELMLEGMKRGAVRATLEVRQNNVVAHSLYLKYGFKDIAIRKNYYSDNSENAIIMWAEEIDSPANVQKLRQNLRQIEVIHGHSRQG